MNNIESQRIRLANKFGLEGLEVVDWLEPSSGSDDSVGSPILMPKRLPATATESTEF
jgi:hypothetical protein